MVRRHLARGLTIAMLAFAAVAHAPAGADASHEARSVTLANALRRSVGSAPLTVDSRLSAVARRWAGVMASNGQLAHNPNVQSEAPSDWRVIGENVGYGDSVDGIHAMWENSSAHYRNLTSPEFTNVGAGFVEGGGYLWGVLVFTGGGSLGSPAPADAPAAPAPAPAPALEPEPEAAPPAVEESAASPASADDMYATDGFAGEEEANHGPNPVLADDPAPADDGPPGPRFGGFFGGTPSDAG